MSKRRRSAKATEALRDEGADVHALVTDVSKAEQVQALADESLKRFGAVHVLCNNAGIGIPSGPSWETTLDDWKWTIDVNLMGVIHGVRSFVPIMLEQGSESHIVNTASIAGLVAGGDLASYAVTKFGVVALSEHLCMELEGAGAKTKVSVLCPGFVATKIMDSERNRPADRQDASPMPTDPQTRDLLRVVSRAGREGSRPPHRGRSGALRHPRRALLHPDPPGLELHDRAPDEGHPRWSEPQSRRPRRESNHCWRSWRVSPTEDIDPPRTSASPPGRSSGLATSR